MKKKTMLVLIIILSIFSVTTNADTKTDDEIYRYKTKLIVNINKIGLYLTPSFTNLDGKSDSERIIQSNNILNKTIPIYREISNMKVPNAVEISHNKIKRWADSTIQLFEIAQEMVRASRNPNSLSKKEKEAIKKKAIGYPQLMYNNSIQGQQMVVAFVEILSIRLDPPNYAVTETEKYRRALIDIIADISRLPFDELENTKLQVGSEKWIKNLQNKSAVLYKKLAKITPPKSLRNSHQKLKKGIDGIIGLSNININIINFSLKSNASIQKNLPEYYKKNSKKISEYSKQSILYSEALVEIFEGQK
jgi:hypothetical protein